MAKELVSNQVYLGSAHAVPPGQGRCYVVGPLEIAVFRQRDGKIFATENLCPHRQGPLSEGLPARYRRWDWAACEYAEWVQLPSSEVVVLEGCGSGALPVGRAASVLVWVEAEESVRRARGLARDPGYAPFWDRWSAQERRLYEADRTWERADLFLDTTGDRR